MKTTVINTAMTLNESIIELTVKHKHRIKLISHTVFASGTFSSSSISIFKIQTTLLLAVVMQRRPQSQASITYSITATFLLSHSARFVPPHLTQSRPCSQASITYSNITSFLLSHCSRFVPVTQLWYGEVIHICPSCLPSN